MNIESLINHLVRTLDNIDYFDCDHLERIIHDYRGSFDSYEEYERFVSRYSFEKLKYGILKNDYKYLLEEYNRMLVEDVGKADCSYLEIIMDHFCQVYINRNGKFFDYGDDKCGREIEEILNEIYGNS